MVSLSKVRETTVRAAGASKSPGSTPRATTNNPATPYTQSCRGQRPRISRTSGIDRLGDAHIDPGAELPENDIGQSFRRAYLRTTSVRRRQPTQIDGAPRTFLKGTTPIILNGCRGAYHRVCGEIPGVEPPGGGSAGGEIPEVEPPGACSSSPRPDVSRSIPAYPHPGAAVGSCAGGRDRRGSRHLADGGQRRRQGGHTDRRRADLWSRERGTQTNCEGSRLPAVRPDARLDRACGQRPAAVAHQLGRGQAEPAFPGERILGGVLGRHHRRRGRLAAQSGNPRAAAVARAGRNVTRVKQPQKTNVVRFHRICARPLHSM